MTTSQQKTYADSTRKMSFVSIIRYLTERKTFFYWCDSFLVGLDLLLIHENFCGFYEGWNFNNGNYLFTTDTK